MQEENALIGVAEAAFFPDISLSGMLAWIGKNPLPFSAANEVWSLGAAATQPIFDGGLRSAQLDAARAAYWQSVATYRQTVLTAFQRSRMNSPLRISYRSSLRCSRPQPGTRAHGRQCVFKSVSRPARWRSPRW